jgi:hypothetical protein
MSNVILKVNGTDVPLNVFVSRVFENVIGGLVDSLDKLPNDKKKIEITLEEPVQ